jgi:hypothetical protein
MVLGRGQRYPYTLASMNNLALVLSNKGGYEQAEEIQSKY